MKNVTIKALIDWLETKPPLETYNYVSPDNCLLAQYLKAKGYPLHFAGVGPDEWRDTYGKEHSFNSNPKVNDKIREIARAGNPFGPRTFGEALRFARSL